MDDLELKGILGSIDVRKLDDKIKEGLENLVKELIDVNGGFQNDLATISIDENLTDKGKAAKKQHLGDVTFESLEPYRNAYQDHLKEAEMQLFNDPNAEPKQPIELMTDQMRQMELRTMYKVSSMDELEMEAHIDDPGFVEAIATSPKPLLAPDRLQKLIRKKAVKDQPQIAELLAQYVYSAATVKGLVSKIESDVRASGWKDAEDLLNPKPIPFRDEVAELAK